MTSAMSAQTDQLNSMFVHFDDWFQDLTLSEPIDQFQLLEEDEEETTVRENEQHEKVADDGTVQVDKKTRMRLGQITRATNFWFKHLDRPLITDDDFDLSDIEEENELEHKPTSNAAREAADEEDHQLDTFARDLEQLLEGYAHDDESNNLKKVNRNAEQDIHFWTHHNTDEMALQDPAIGYCCAVSTSIDRHSQAITVLQSSLCNTYRSSNDLNDAGDVGDASKPASSEHQTQTPMPVDHDYLARPKQKPLLACNRISKENSPELSLAYLAVANCKRQRMASSVLNTGAIKRLARFSDRIRLLSCE